MSGFESELPREAESAQDVRATGKSLRPRGAVPKAAAEARAASEAAAREQAAEGGILPTVSSV